MLDINTVLFVVIAASDPLAYNNLFFLVEDVALRLRFVIGCPLVSLDGCLKRCFIAASLELRQILGGEKGSLQIIKLSLLGQDDFDHPVLAEIVARTKTEFLSRHGIVRV